MFVYSKMVPQGGVTSLVRGGLWVDTVDPDAWGHRDGISSPLSECCHKSSSRAQCSTCDVFIQQHLGAMASQHPHLRPLCCKVFRWDSVGLVPTINMWNSSQWLHFCKFECNAWICKAIFDPKGYFLHSDSIYLLCSYMGEPNVVLWPYMDNKVQAILHP